MENRTWHKEHHHKIQSDNSVSAPRKINIVGCRIRHNWKEESGQVTKWKGIVLDRVTVNPSLYLIKYDGSDLVYGMELYKDERISDVEVFQNKIKSMKIRDVFLARTIIGKPVEHMFETQGGSKRKWRGMVLALVPTWNTWFYTAYEEDPILYVYELLNDYKEGDLCIIPNSKDSPLTDKIPDRFIDGSLVGEQVVNVKEDGSSRTGIVIHQVKAKPSVYFLKFDGDFHIYVYDLVQSISG